MTTTGNPKARRAAEDALRDRVPMVVSPEAQSDFLKRLDRPVRPNARLKRTMRTTPPWKAD